MEKIMKPSVKPKKRKRSKSPTKSKINKNNASEPLKNDSYGERINENLSSEMYDKFPILKNEQLVQRFQTVPLTNNQKGRIRQVLRDNLKGTADSLLPEVIHNKIQTILKSSSDLTDSDLRKIRILYNMLKTTILSGKKTEKKTKPKLDKKKHEPKEKVKETQDIKIKDDEGLAKNSKDVSKDTKSVQKVKGPKRYVVFVGNLPKEINKDMILKHFCELCDFIKDVRIPKQKSDKSSIAYIELANEPSFELALSKHHSMLGNKRINVLYTAQKKGKISKTDAKSKSAKLIALQRSGKLMGSVPLVKKRSHRRKIRKQALAKQNAESG